MANKKKNEAAAEMTAEALIKTEGAAETVTPVAAAETAVAVPSEEKDSESKVPEKKPSARKSKKAAVSEQTSAEKTTKGRKAKQPKEEISAVEEKVAPAAEEAPKKTARRSKKTAVAAEKAAKTPTSRTAASKKKDTAAEAEKPKQTRRSGTSKAKGTVSPYDAAVKLVSNKTCKIRTAKKDFAAQFTLTGSAEGVFFVKSEGGKVDVQPWDYKDADVNVTVDADALKKLVDGKLNFEKAVEKGLLEMSCGVNTKGEDNSKLCLSTIVALKKILLG